MNLGGAQLIRCLLFDVDDTLMDYHQAEMQILRRIFAENGKVPSQAELDDLWEKSWLYWNLRGLHETWREEIQRDYVRLYRDAVTDYCAYMRRKYDLKQDENALYELFGRYLGEAVTLYDDVLPVLKMLKGYFVLCAASNALSDCQRPRLRAMGIRFDHIFLSEEMGTIKPAQVFFRKAAQAAGCETAECMMVGDSLSSDIAGAQKAGMKTCWINRAGRALSGEIQPDAVIQNLHQLLKIKEIREGLQNDRI